MKTLVAPLALVVLAAPIWSADLAQSITEGRRHGPIIIHERHGSSITSTNWSGYAATGGKGSITSVTASWIIPAIVGTCPSEDQFASFWVGIDGYSSNTVEQIGTDSDCQSGVPTYYVWFEFYPHASYNVNSVPIKPGDKIFAKVNSSGKGMFTVELVNETTRASFSTTTKVASADQSSAEWIAEAPYEGGVLPLAPFGTVQFGDDYTRVTGTCEATISGVTQFIGSFADNVSINMDTTKGVLKDETSPLSEEGSFSVTWLSAGP
jgi:hypothetical protein